MYGVVIDMANGKVLEDETRKMRQELRDKGMPYSKEPTVVRVAQDDINFMITASTKAKRASQSHATGSNVDQRADLVDVSGGR